MYALKTLLKSLKGSLASKKCWPYNIGFGVRYKRDLKTPKLFLVVL